MPITDVARRGTRALRRMVNGVRHTGSAGPDPELQKVRKQVRALRTELADSEAEVKKLRSELGRTRDSVRDPDPTVVLPDSVTQTIAQVRNERLTYLKEANLGCARPHRGRSGTRTRPRPDHRGRHRPRWVGHRDGGGQGGRAADEGVRRVRDDPAAHREGRRRRPPPLRIITRGESKGVAGDTYYGYRDDLYSEVTESFDRLGSRSAPITSSCCRDCSPTPWCSTNPLRWLIWTAIGSNRR